MKGKDPVPTVDGLKEEMADGYSRAVASRSRRACVDLHNQQLCWCTSHLNIAELRVSGAGAHAPWDHRQTGALKRARDENEELIGRCVLGVSSSVRGTAGGQTRSCSSRRVRSEWWGPASQTGCPPVVGVKPQKR